jgi:hypothetical protein
VYGVKEGTGNATTLLELTSQFGNRLKIGTPFEEYRILGKLAYQLAAY